MLKKQSKTKLPWNEVRFVSILAFCFLCGGCAGNKVNPEISSQEPTGLSLQPPPLQVEHLSLDKLLQSYDFLNDKNRIIALKHFLSQNDLNDRQKAEAAYMLGRLIQQSADATQGQALRLFDQAQTYPPLKINSLWHKSEIAAILGQEKLVRQILTALLPELKVQTSIAAAKYSLAQSYVRASETDNAARLLKQIRADFPGTDYAIGADYYLGTLSYSQFEQKSHNKQNLSQSLLSQLNNQSSPAQLLKDACNYYFEYLQASPGGHFTADILVKLANLCIHNVLLAKERELILMANAYSAIGEYKSSLACWQKVSANKHLLPVANCLVKLGQIGLAQEKFFQGLVKDSHNELCLTLANEISSHLKRADCLRFWQRLHYSKFVFQDRVLWNLAIRSSFSDALHYYQDILVRYPESAYAPEAQWWLLWHKFKSTKISLLPTVAPLFRKAAVKYNHCSLTARFLFWAGKISEKIGDRQEARFYYQQALAQCPYGYYGQRASARLNFITDTAPDNYFGLKYRTYSNTAAGNPGINQLVWDCRTPERAISDLKQKGELTLYELIYIKQYAEALLDDNNLSPELVSWLQGINGQPWLAINTASRRLEEKPCPVADCTLVWQYSFPLLYNQEITFRCQNTHITDPLLVQALIREESRYNPHAVSQAQAVGLCQLMPATASSVAHNANIRIVNKEQLFQPDLNIRLGIIYLSSALQTFRDDALLAVASYNAGVNAVKNFNKQEPDPDQFVEDFPFSETRDYMRKVFTSYWHYVRIYEHR